MKAFSHIRHTLGITKAAQTASLEIIVGGNAGKIFVFRASPKVICRTCNIHHVGCIGCDKPMLVKRQGTFVVDIFIIILAKPIGELII